jgi:hypothetical protein
MNATTKTRRDIQNAKRGEAGRKFWNTGATATQMASEKRECEVDREMIADKNAKRNLDR